MVTNAKLVPLAVVAVASLSLACGESAPPPPQAAPPPAASAAPPAVSAPTATASAAPEQPAPGAAHRLVVTVASCWFGGFWSDAEGNADTPDARAAYSEARCHEANKIVFGSDDKEKFEQLRALDANAVEDAGAKVQSVAANDTADRARGAALGRWMNALAAAKKEQMLAHRAADRVKRDLDREPEKLNADEVAAVKPLRDTAALDALLKLDVGDVTPEAHAMGVMIALERAGLARGLPKHLKVYAVSGPFKELFGVEPPAVPDDATKPLKPGTWLAALVAGARAAGHPLPDKAKTPAEKEPAAWAGVLEGMHDKLVADAAKIGDETPLRGIVERVAKRLQHEFDEARNALRASEAKGSATAPKPAPPPKSEAPKKK